MALYQHRVTEPEPPALLPERRAADRELHQRLLDGDTDALRETFVRYGKDVLRVALTVTRDPTAAEDVTQVVMLELWSRPENYRPDVGPLRSWIMRASHNRSVDWVRREEGRRRRQEQELLLASDHLPTVEELAERINDAEKIRLLLMTLPENERIPIELAYYAGRTYRQVATDLAIPEGTAKARIRAGLRRLATRWAASEG